jgi:hypothetical protein
VQQQPCTRTNTSVTTTTIQIEEYDEDLIHLVCPPTIDEELATKTAEAARARMDQIRLNITTSNDATLVSLSWKDVQIQRIMGIGGFATVSLVRVSNTKLDKQKWYALKCLNKKIMMIDDPKKEKRFVRAARDLCTEAVISVTTQEYYSNPRRHGG